MKKVVLLFWFIAGIAVIISKEPNLFMYILCWINLLIYLIKDIVEVRNG